MGMDSDEAWLEDVKDVGRVCRFFLCCGPFVFLFIWMIDAIIGAIYYDVWYPRFELQDMQVYGFNVTPTYHEIGELELNYELLYFIEARHFSGLRAIEKYTYHVTTMYEGFELGTSVVTLLHLHLKDTQTCVFNLTQRAVNLPLEYATWSSLQNDTQVNNNVYLSVEVKGDVSSGLFWAMIKSKTQICDLNLRPPSSMQSAQVMNMTCHDPRKAVEGP